MNHTKLKNILNNLHNGNLTDAKEKAKVFSFWKLLSHMEEMGYQLLEAYNTASYLKGKCTFQEYCNKKASPVGWIS